MDFANTTSWPGGFLAGSTAEREMLGIAVCKATWRVDGGRLAPAPAAERWPVFDKPFTIGGVTLGVELEHRKQGIDLLVLGSAQAPHGRPVERLEVGIASGRLQHRTLVIGDRRWERSWGRLRPTPPTPFTTMPLTNDRAFGGCAQYDGQPLPHAINPHGRGYHVTKEGADGQPLPNLELPERPIAAWTDQPLPACWYKPAGALELGAGGDPQALTALLMERSFNHTVPALIAGDGQLGERAQLTGFAAEGPLDFPLPPAQGPVGHVSLGGRRSVIPSRLASVVLLVEARAVVATYVCLFRYLMQPREKRAVELRWPGAAHA
jgi:hypothetical protein